MEAKIQFIKGLDEKVLPGPGWATLCLCNDGQHAVLGNFFNGQIGKFELASGQMVASAETEVERSVAGIAEFPIQQQLLGLGVPQFARLGQE